ncbi:MAG: undecaprenyldiphospho-muramoylpentapeptide beta-N-acetylglucosaminyltransferase [Alphaproteobacteria bacterium]
MTKPLIVLGAGGTGGHLFPAEATALELLEHGFRVAIATDKKGQGFSAFENHKDVEIIRFSGGGVASGSIIAKAKGGLSLCAGILQAYRWFKKNKPAVAIGFGGFASIPPIMAARYTKTPYILHEQNAVLGRANQMLAKHAKAIATGFKEVQKCPENIEQVWVGTPVRGTFLLDPIRNYHTTKFFNLLVLGGSQGARALTTLIPQAINLLPEALVAHIHVTQQVRNENMAEAKEAWANSSAKYELAPFYKQVGQRMADAHLYIGRSGASSVSECLATALPAIMIPYPHAVDDHQYFNAKNLADQGCGWVIREEEVTPEILADALKTLIFNPQRLEDASMACEKNAKLDATKHIADMVSAIIKQNQG